MKIMRPGFLIGSLMALLVIVTAPAFATLVLITNPSFEVPEITTPGGYNSLISGWTKTGNSGTWYPYVAVPDGHQVAYAYGGTVSQVLSDQIETGGTYILAAYVRKYYNNDNQEYRVQLYAVHGGVDMLLTEVYGVPINYQQYYHVSTDAWTAPSFYDGDPIKIKLVGSVAGLDFDMVTLDYIAIPIPAGLLLLGSGILGLVGLKGIKKIRT